MVFTDSHTHLYSEEFDRDRAEAVTRAAENGVALLFLPAIDASYHERMLAVSREFPQQCLPMMGLHPTSVKENFREELATIEKYLAAGTFRFCAIGEVGIDLYWDKTHEDEQRIAFSHQIDLALKYDLPLVIHTRNSMDIALDILAERQDPQLRGVFHCFSGNTEQAVRATGLGFLLGIGGVITYKNSGLQTVVENTELRHLLLETDAPWLPPVPYRGQRNEPSYIPIIARKIAELKNITVEEVAEVTTAGAKALFGVKSEN
jgi:TatD DNase family protein